MRRVVALLALLAPPLAAQVFVDAHDALPTSGRDVAGGDLDGDGSRDLVTVSSSTGAVPTASLLPWLSNGSGDVLPGASKVLMAGANSVSLADMNLDGRLDAVVSATGAAPLYFGGVSTLLGDGAGGFPSLTAQFVAGAPAGHALADVNGDGILDVALALPATAQVALLLGTGAGGFAAPTLLTAGPKPIAVALPDLQLDGAPDLVVLNGVGATVSVRLGAAGAFGAVTSFGTGPGSTALLVARLDGDVFPDVLVANGGDATLSLLRGDGAGGLLPQQVSPLAPKPVALGAADIDLDGDLDVLVAENFAVTQQAQGGALLLNDGAGNLSAPVAFVVGMANGASLDVADLDGDVLPDLALVTGSGLERRRGDGLGGFFDVPFFAAGVTPAGVAVAALNGDRAPDVAVANTGPDEVATLMGDGTGALSAPSGFALGFDGNPNDLVAVDVTGDGATDLVTANVKTNNVSVLAGNGLGGFAAPVTVACGSAEPRALAAADLDGDGDPDVVTCNTTGSSISVLRASGGTLLPGVPTVTGGSHATALALGHADAGGTVDAVTANDFSNSFSLLRGDGAGGWLAPVTYQADGDTVRGLALADLDGDGDDELIAAIDDPGNDTGHLDVRLSNGAGGFGPATLTTIVRSGADVVAADFDLDGALDVAVAHDGVAAFGVAQLTLLLGNGAGGFKSVGGHLVNVPASSLAAADLDADGAPDLVAAVQPQSRVAVLRNVSQGGPWHPLGSALAGDFAPQLAGAGLLRPGTPGSLTLIDAPPLAPGALFFAPSSAPVPFKGGTLVPVPPAITSFLVVPANGIFKLPWTSFPPVGSGSTFYFQAAALDAGAPAGVALSNALEGVAP